MIPFSRRRGASQTFRCPCRCNLHSTPGAITTKPNAYINANWIFWIAGKPRAHSLSRNSATNHASKIAPPLDYAQSLQRCSGTVSANLHSSGSRAIRNHSTAGINDNQASNSVISHRRSEMPAWRPQESIGKIRTPQPRSNRKVPSKGA